MTMNEKDLTNDTTCNDAVAGSEPEDDEIRRPPGNTNTSRLEPDRKKSTDESPNIDPCEES